MKTYSTIEGFVEDLTLLAYDYREHLAAADGLYRMELTDGRTWYVRIDQGVVSVTDASDDAPCCTVHSSEREVLDLLSGKLHPVKAILTRKVRVSGDVKQLLRLASLVK